LKSSLSILFPIQYSSSIPHYSILANLLSLWILTDYSTPSLSPYSNFLVNCHLTVLFSFFSPNFEGHSPFNCLTFLLTSFPTSSRKVNGQILRRESTHLVETAKREWFRIYRSPRRQVERGICLLDQMTDLEDDGVWRRLLDSRGIQACSGWDDWEEGLRYVDIIDIRLSLAFLFLCASIRGLERGVRSRRSWVVSETQC